MNVEIAGAAIRCSRPVAPVADQSEPFLGPADRQRAAGFRRAADRDRFVTGRRLLAEYLRDELGCRPDDYEVHRPTVRPGEWRPVLRPLRPNVPPLPAFSIAHSGDRVVLAVARDPAIGDIIGVDVEQLPAAATAEQLIDDIGAHALSPRERARLPVERLGRQMAVLRCFVRKEAVLKAVGFGLAIDPTAVEFQDRPDGPILTRFDSPHAAPLRLVDLPMGDGYAAALAVGAGTADAAPPHRPRRG